VPQQEKEPRKTKTTKDWEKEKQLQKTFELIIQQKQALESTLKIALRSQPLMQKSFGPSKLKSILLIREQLLKNMTCSKKSVNNY
jgi:hypothetical protein